MSLTVKALNKQSWRTVIENSHAKCQDFKTAFHDVVTTTANFQSLLKTSFKDTLCEDIFDVFNLSAVQRDINESSPPRILS